MTNVAEKGTSGPVAMDARRMRRHNCEQVLRVVRRHGPLSRAEIARHTRLSAPTVAAAVGDLARARMVDEPGEGESTGGRRPRLVAYNARFGAVVGGNVGATAVRLVLADLHGEILARETLEFAAGARPGPLLRRAARAVERMRSSALGPDVPLLAGVFGAPGMTDITRGVVLEAANLEGWTDVPAGEILERALGVPVTVDNDVNLAALGEHWRGLGRGLSDFVFVALGTGIGAGIVLGDRLHRGHTWYAGEIGRLNVDFREWDADFGAAGYLECYAGQRPARRPEGARRQGFDRDAVLRLGAGIANIASVLDPEAFILGGRAALAHPELAGEVYEVARRIAPNCPELRLTELGEDAPLHGSVKLALDRVEALLPGYLDG